MIDKMIRCKNLEPTNQIGSLDEWFQKCPPKRGLEHWVDGRSAKETAKHWVYTIPQPFKEILKEWKLKYKLCSPEFQSSFDSCGGENRNHDLLIMAEKDENTRVLITVESKADESFSYTISETIEKARKRKNENKDSKGLERIEDLRVALFGQVDDSQLDLRYQLLTAVAGTIAEAKKQNSRSAIFLVQTFVSDEIDAKKHKRNKDDLNAFVRAFSKSRYDRIDDNKLIGPFTVTNPTKYLPNDIELWIGKFEIEI